jgi:hypothetical protein
MLGGGRVGLSVAFVVFDGLREVFCGGFEESGGLVEKDDRAQGAFGEFEQGALASFAARAEEGGILPGGFFGAVGFFRWRDGPLG